MTCTVIRALLPCLLAGVLLAQQQPPEPPEEDASIAPVHYDFNPVQAKKEISAGNFYFKKSNYRAAATRFREASRWDPGSVEAFLRWGEASEKARDYPAAREAFTKYFEISDDEKLVEAIKKRMAKWPKNARPAAEKTSGPLNSVPNLNPPPPRTHR